MTLAPPRPATRPESPRIVFGRRPTRDAPTPIAPALPRGAPAPLPSTPSAPAAPSSPSAAAANAPCAVCHATGQPDVRLAHEASRRELTVCLRCVRSQMRLQANLSEGRLRHLLEGYAEEHGGQVWHSHDVAYVMPSTGPFAAATAPALLVGAPRVA